MEVRKQKEKWVKNMNKHQKNRANKHMNRCSASLVIKEMQIKQQIGYNLKDGQNPVFVFRQQVSLIHVW